LDHILEDSLEQYAMGKLPDSETGPLEEHQLVCHECQDRLWETDKFLAAFRAVASEGDLGIERIVKPTTE